MITDIWRWWPAKLDLCFSTWDCTFKSLEAARKEPDYVAGHVWGVSGTKLYLAPWEFHQQVGITETIQGILKCRAWAEDQGLPLSGYYVEDKANGPAVIELLRQHVPGVQAWPGDDEDWRKMAASSKESRAQAAAVYVRAGNVVLPSPEIAPWIGAWVAEVETYPQAAHDDRVDGLSMACAIAFLRPGRREGRDYWAGIKGIGRV